jgi:hypothetical protein
MLKALRISAMLLALVGTAHAGDMFTPPVVPPHTVVVEEPSPVDSSANDTPYTLMEIALDLLAVLPSLF